MAEEKVTNIEVEDNRLDKKVTVRSIAPWVTGSPRKTTSGDVSIPANGTILLSREEIIAQSQNGNRLLNGIDGVGSHATWYVEDEFVRKELSYDIGAKKQDFLSEDLVKKMFDLKTMKSFEENIRKNVITRAEGAYLLETIKKLGINDYQKISFCETFTGMRMK